MFLLNVVPPLSGHMEAPLCCETFIYIYIYIHTYINAHRIRFHGITPFCSIVWTAARPSAYASWYAGYHCTVPPLHVNSGDRTRNYKRSACLWVHLSRDSLRCVRRPARIVAMFPVTTPTLRGIAFNARLSLKTLMFCNGNSLNAETGRLVTMCTR